jgi:phenylalanine-4-hydroxylase
MYNLLQIATVRHRTSTGSASHFPPGRELSIMPACKSSRVAGADIMSPDWTISQDWGAYSPEEHATWDRLFARQTTLLPGRAVPEFMEGLDVLRLTRPGIPDFEELSDRLMKRTGWQVVAVPGLVPDRIFFEHLANRRFVAGRFIRKPEQIDYLEEPDVFHDVFGHVPLLAHPIFADYMQAYGRGGLKADSLGAIDYLARLYWYTVEFGLIAQDDGLKLYGAGIVSSHAESIFALDDPSPNRIGFDLKRVMQTRYRIDDYQQSYFVIDSFEDLLAQTESADLTPLYAELKDMADLKPDELLPTDRIFTRGTQDHAKIRAWSAQI